MKLTEEQIEYIASHIRISDILNYIENNRSEYEEFLKEEKEKEKKENGKE